MPYPLPNVTGRVNSGIQTITADLKVRSAEQIALPTAFKWPLRICQPKRCLLVTRIPLEESGRELVLINLHMDPWEDGDGKNEQTQFLAGFMQAEYELGNYVIAGGDFNQAFPKDNLTVYPIRNDRYFVPERLEWEMFEGKWTFASDISACWTRHTAVPAGGRSTMLSIGLFCRLTSGWMR